MKIFDNHRKHFWPGDSRDLSDVVLVNNEDWYSEMNIIDFLTAVGRHFRMGAMLSRQSVKSRKLSIIAGKKAKHTAFSEIAVLVCSRYFCAIDMLIRAHLVRTDVITIYLLFIGISRENRKFPGIFSYQDLSRLF